MAWLINDAVASSGRSEAPGWSAAIGSSVAASRSVARSVRVGSRVDPRTQTFVVQRCDGPVTRRRPSLMSTFAACASAASTRTSTARWSSASRSRSWPNATSSNPSSNSSERPQTVVGGRAEGAPKCCLVRRHRAARPGRARRDHPNVPGLQRWPLSVRAFSATPPSSSPSRAVSCPSQFLRSVRSASVALGRDDRYSRRSSIPVERCTQS
jgi:hypothetical protein